MSIQSFQKAKHTGVGVATNLAKNLYLKTLFETTKKYYHIYIATISATQYMGGSCVDPDKTIYMFRYSFKENDNPVHVMPYFGASECRELSNMAKRSKNPNFICCHLKISVQRVIESAISLCIRYLENRPLQESPQQESLFNRKMKDNQVL